MSDRGYALAKNTLILTIGRVISHAAIFLTLPVYTFFLSADEYGLVDLLVTYVALCAPFVTLRLESGIFRFVTEHRSGGLPIKAQYLRQAIKISTLNLAIAVALIAIAGLVFQFQYTLHFVLLLLSIVYFTIIAEFARGLGRTRDYTLAQIIVGVATLLVSMLLIIGFQLDIAGALLAQTTANVLATLFIAHRVRISSYLLSPSEPRRDTRRELLGYSAPLLPTSVSWWVINASDRSVIAAVLGMALSGIYAVANKFASILMVIFPMFSMAFTESAILHVKEKDSAQFFSHAFDKILRVSAALGMLIIAGVGLCLPWLVGADFLEARTIIPILVLAVFFNNIVGLYSALYAAHKKTSKIMKISIIAALVKLALLAGLIVPFGLYGAAISTLAAYVAMAAMSHVGIRGIVNVSYSARLALLLALCWTVTIALFYASDGSAILSLLNIMFALSAAVALNLKTAKGLLSRFRQKRAE